MGTRKKTSKWVIISLILVITYSGAFADRIIYVDDDAAGANDGSSWFDAYKYLQDALMMASAGDELRVAQGIYKPDQFVLSKRPNLGRMETFQLKNEVVIRGGYAGLSQADPNTRDVDLYETILSGDLNANDVDVNDPRDFYNNPTRIDNSYHVVTGSGTDTSAIIDGFIITGGNAIHRNGVLRVSDPNNWGGGVYSDSGGPTFINCTFTYNTGCFGGGMCNVSGSPTLEDCTFSYNAGCRGGGMYNRHGEMKLINCAFVGNATVSMSGYSDVGGGMHNYWSTLTLTSSKFSGNSAVYGGGGISNIHSQATLIGCTFSGNSANSGGGIAYSHSGGKIKDCFVTGNIARDSDGGGIYCVGEQPVIVNCTVKDNKALLDGGGICFQAAYGGKSYIARLSNSVITGNAARKGGGVCCWTRSVISNCTFAGNAAVDDGGGIACPSQVTLINSIFWSNKDRWRMDGSAHVHPLYGSKLIVSYNCIQDLTDALSELGNISDEPLFARPGYWDPNGTPDDPNDDLWIDGDYHLKSQASRWDPDSQSWVQDDVTSPCIDAGDPMSPIGDEPFPNGGIINMGAYGGTAEASKSYFGEPVCETIVAGDINGDCKVDFKDFVIMAYHWLDDRSP
jgi:hypothetical protein